MCWVRNHGTGKGKKIIKSRDLINTRGSNSSSLLVRRRGVEILVGELEGTQRRADS